MSDLQCAARLFIACSADGRGQALDLAETLAAQRIARIWTSPLVRARETAEIAAARLGVEVVVRHELADEGPADQETADLVDRVRGVLEEAADLHRGESVLVVSHGAVIDRVVPSLAVNLRAGHGLAAPMPPGGVVELDGDADGWVARSWAGEALA